EPEPGGHLLDHPVRLELHVDHHARQVVVELVEADDALVRHAARRLPGDAVVLATLGDAAFPLPLAEPDLLLEADLVVPLPLDAKQAVHDLRPRAELRPLGVALAAGDSDIGPALDGEAARLLPAGPAPASTSAGNRLRESLAGDAAAAELLLRAFDGFRA